MDIHSITLGKRQELADKFTNEVMSVIYGERFVSLEDVEDDEELNVVWDALNEKFYDAILSVEV